MRDIFVAIPAYSGDVCVQTLSSLLYAVEEAREQGWRIRPENVQLRISDADISQARNCFLGWFLATECTDLLWLDADISFGAGVLKRLFAHDVDIVAGAYRSKLDIEGYPILWPDKRVMHVDPATGFPLLEVRGVGMGLTRMSRACVEKMSENAPRHFQDPIAPDRKCPWLFEFAFDGGQRYSEDYTFCRRWRELGGKVWIDPTLCVDHTGKKTYVGNLMSFLERQTASYIDCLPEDERQSARLAMMLGKAA